MQKNIEIDYIRVISMFGVIIIHVTSGYIKVYSNYMFLDMNIAFILNQMVRFSVPMFILVSGLVLNFSEKKYTSSYY